MIKGINHKNKIQTIILFLIILFAGGALMLLVAHLTDGQMRAGLRQHARIAALVINIEHVTALSGSEKDLNTPAYQRIKSQLALMRNTVKQCRFLYLMGQRADGTVFFFVDSLPTDSEDYAPPGLVYKEVSDPYLHVFDTKKEAVVGPITDRWGTLVTALIPLKTPNTDNFIALLGIDIDASDWNKAILLRCSIPFTAMVLLMILLLLAASREQAVKSRYLSEEKVRNILENTTNLFYSHTPDHILTYLSPQIEDLLGYTVEEAQIQWTEFASDNPINEERFQKTAVAIETGKRQPTYDLELIRKDGRKIIVEVRESPLVENGKTVAMVGSLTDITERKQAEQEKIKAWKIAGEQKKLALVGQIAGKMAHDFNNILGIIMGNAELSLIDCKDAATRKTLQLIFEQTLKGKNLTRNLVAFAKDQEPKQEFFRINEMIDLVLNLLKKDLEGIEITKEENPGVPKLLADPEMIEHALVNLIQNSIHATSMIEQPQIVIRTFHKDKYIYIEIEDNGCGISEEALDSIYEPAFTMKGSRDITGSYKPDIKGTGYGMANVKKYIEQHKGNIIIDSKVEKGTNITISFPVIKKELTEKEIIEIKKETLYFEKYILLVEDEQSLSDVQYKILTDEPCNHKVDKADNGQMAVDLFNRNKYDFVSLDYILPGELNGMDVYKHIRQTNATIPILFVSGNLDFLESIKELKHKDPCVEHISKPCQNKDYVSSINDLLERT